MFFHLLWHLRSAPQQINWVLAVVEWISEWVSCSARFKVKSVGCACTCGRMCGEDAKLLVAVYVAQGITTCVSTCILRRPTHDIEARRKVAGAGFGLAKPQERSEMCGSSM